MWSKSFSGWGSAVAWFSLQLWRGVSTGVPLAMKVATETVDGLLGEGAINNACQATSYPATCNQTLAGGNYTADTSGDTRNSLQVAETRVNATLEFVLRLNATNPNVTVCSCLSKSCMLTRWWCAAVSGQGFKLVCTTFVLYIGDRGSSC